MKVCIWENVASPHQSHFFSALAAHPAIDFQARYFEKFDEERVKLGWQDNTHLPPFEAYVEPDLDQALQTLPDWRQRIHVVPGNSYPFTRSLIAHLVANNVPWIHWSERSGYAFAEKIRFNPSLFKKTYPLLSRLLKASYATLINRHALGAFGQGFLATKDFQNWGVLSEKTADLFYTIGPIPENLPLPPEFEGERERHTLLFAGSLTHRKGVDLLIRAFARLKRAQKWRLLIVGDGPDKEKLLRLAKNLLAPEKFDFLGARPIETVPAYIAAADLFVLPTRFDGWGAVLNEAAAVGKAIVSTDECGAAYHLIEEGRNGFRVEAGSVAALARALQRYVDDSVLLRSHGDASKRLYQSGFTPQKNVERFLHQLEKWKENGSR